MSASREKKNRQEVAASGAVDPKTARQAQEQAKERRSNRLYAIIAIAFVVVAIGLVVWNSNIIQRGTTAVTVEGESYSAAEVSYYYHNAYNSIVNSKYASLYGIDKNTSLSQQNLNDTAKMMLRVSEDMTWDAYFRDAAKKSLIQLTMLKKGAAEKGMTFNDDMQKEVDRTVETFSTYAKKAGYSTSAYLKLMYGNNMTMSTFKSILKDTLLASHYQQDYIDSLTYTDEEVETYYNEHKNNFDVADYEYIYFKGTADSTKDADGNTVKPTDEENAAAKEAASANANAALEAVRNGLLMEKAADNYDNGTYTVQNVTKDCTVHATFSKNSSSGGSFSSSTRYTVSVEDTDNGSVKVSPTRASKGSTVTVTVKPDEGYELDELTVTDKNGDSVKLTDKGDGKFSFVMPDSKVDVKATFVKSEVQPDQPTKNTFVDVPENSWYADAADFVAQRGLMSGVGENLFGGNQNTTRAMLMTILARMDGQDVTGGATWYEKAMNWAKQTGVSDGTMPEVNITREQLATMLYSYAKLKGLDTTQGGMAVREFNDYDSISSWAGQSMTWAVNAGILSGRGNNTLAPTAGATRAEMAVMLQQFVGLMEQ